MGSCRDDTSLASSSHLSLRTNLTAAGFDDVQVGPASLYTYNGNEALVKKDDGVGVTIYAGELYERYEMPPGGPGIEDDFGDGDADGWSPAGGTW